MSHVATDSSEVSVPETLDEALSPDWLTRALGVDHPGIEVTAVHPGPVVSRVSTNARFRIECAGGVPPGLSSALCVKGYFTEEQHPARFTGVCEAGFYRHLATDSGVRTLRCVHANVDPETSANVVVTEDVIDEGGEFLEPGSGYTPDQVASTLEQLAVLHASTWMSAPLADIDWLVPRFELVLAARGEDVVRDNFESAVGARVPDAVRDPQRLYRAYSRVVDSTRTAEAWCVLHGDTHVGNLFLDARGRPGFVDWQLVQRGPWWIDVGYHIASTLTVEQRRRHETDLVDHYLARLAGAGVEPPAGDEVRHGIRAGIVYGFYLWSITQKVDPRIIADLLERLGTAAEDHDALSPGP